jgi:hypothetical protein
MSASATQYLEPILSNRVWHVFFCVRLFARPSSSPPLHRCLAARVPGVIHCDNDEAEIDFVKSNSETVSELLKNLL